MKGGVQYVDSQNVEKNADSVCQRFCSFNMSPTKLPTRKTSTKYIFDRARPKHRAMTTVLKERMSEGLQAERAPSDPRPRGRRRSMFVNDVKKLFCLLCQKYTWRRFASRHYVGDIFGGDISRVSISLFDVLLPTLILDFLFQQLKPYLCLIN